MGPSVFSGSLEEALCALGWLHGIESRFYSEFLLIRHAQRLLEAFHRVVLNQVYGAASESAAGHPGAQRPFNLQRAIHEKIQLGAAHFVIVFQAAMGFHQQPSHFAQVAVAAGFDEIENTLVFSQDVACAALGYGMVNERQLIRLRVSETLHAQ